MRHEIIKKNKTKKNIHKDNYSKLSRDNTCGPCSTFKHALWAPNNHLSLDKSFYSNNRCNTNTHHTNL